MPDHATSPQLTAEIKARVPFEQKEAFERIAIARHLKVSDIAREAFREFIAAHAEEARKVSSN
jgi:hypothetical protein